MQVHAISTVKNLKRMGKSVQKCDTVYSFLLQCSDVELRKNFQDKQEFI